MNTLLIPALLGLVIIFLGFTNVKGNLSSIHWYHRQRVTEENKAVFGKLIGRGTMLIGMGLIAFSLFAYAAKQLQMPYLLAGGSVLLMVTVIIGLAVSLYAMIKYNKGIF